MSHRTSSDPAFFKLPPELPLYYQARPCQDIDLEARVNKALLAEFNGNSSWQPKVSARAACWRGWWPLWQSLRCYVAVLLSHAAAFSLGSLIAAHRE